MKERTRRILTVTLPGFTASMFDFDCLSSGATRHSSLGTEDWRHLNLPVLTDLCGAFLLPLLTVQPALVSELVHTVWSHKEIQALINKPRVRDYGSLHHDVEKWRRLKH